MIAVYPLHVRVVPKIICLVYKQDIRNDMLFYYYTTSGNVVTVAN